MSVTRSGPSSSTQPLESVDLPAPESPTRHSMMGRPARNGIAHLRSVRARLREIIHKHDRLGHRRPLRAFGLVPLGRGAALTWAASRPAASLCDRLFRRVNLSGYLPHMPSELPIGGTGARCAVARPFHRGGWGATRTWVAPQAAAAVSCAVLVKEFTYSEGCYAGLRQQYGQEQEP